MIQTLQRWLPRRWRTEPQLPDGPWSAILGSHPFLAELSGPDRFRLRQLSGHFLVTHAFLPAEFKHFFSLNRQLLHRMVQQGLVLLPEQTVFRSFCITAKLRHNGAAKRIVSCDFLQ